MSSLFTPDLKTPLPLPPIDSWPESKHLFDEESCWAVRAALAAERALLIRGEPGIGKSQLARAVAVHYGMPFLYHVVDERTERDDLLHSYDAVSRLAQAQMVSIAFKDNPEKWEEQLAEERFIQPEVLWWAFDWKGAEAQAGRFFRKCPPPKLGEWCRSDPGEESGENDILPCSSVVLVDEIDKADPAVPNGLLECLGNRGFQTAQLGEAVSLPEKTAPPFVVITTNEERELPAAFLRRCLVLNMRFPPENLDVDEFLIGRARVFHDQAEIGDGVLARIVELLQKDRANAGKHGQTRPGAAEFLDIVKALVTLHPGDEKAQDKALDRIGRFALKKSYSESGP